MRKPHIALVATTSLVAGIVVASSAGIALAGVQPVPFRVNLARLDHVATSLSGVTDMIDAVLGIEPQPFCPVLDNVAADEIRDLAKQIQRYEDKVEQVIESVSPDTDAVGALDESCSLAPDGAVEERLGNIRAMTLGILGMIEERLGVSPEPFKVINAAEKLTRNAQSLVDTIDAFLPPPR